MDASLTGIEDRKADTGTMKVSSAALTALDLLRYPHASGGIDNVATVLAELAPAIDAEEPQRLSTSTERAVVQRLGHLLDQIGADGLADPMLHALHSSAPLRWTELERLEPSSDFATDPPLRDAKWRVTAHRLPEPDL